jgi:hypothetical protein
LKKVMALASLKHAVELDPTELERKPFWWRFGVSLSRQASPLP